MKALKKKAEAFVESMFVLETCNLDELDGDEVHKCFRRKALQYHPDKMQNETEEVKKLAKLNWYTIEMARYVAYILLQP